MDWSSKSAIIAEDEDANFLLLAEYLEATGITIYRATNGFELLALLKTIVPEIILMDIKMPFMDGYEATLAIRKHFPDLPIIAQTAHAMAADILKIKEVGCSDYVIKPFSENQLLEMIEKYL